MYYYVNVTIPYGAGFYGPAPDASVTALLRIKTNSITRDAYPSRDLSYSSRKISLDNDFSKRESEDLYKLYIKHPRTGNRNGKYSSGHWPLPSPIDS